ncbi:unnamed protein product [Ectocarpus sp. 13 AM-2016]
MSVALSAWSVVQLVPKRSHAFHTRPDPRPFSSFVRHRQKETPNKTDTTPPTTNDPSVAVVVRLAAARSLCETAKQPHLDRDDSYSSFTRMRVSSATQGITQPTPPRKGTTTATTGRQTPFNTNIKVLLLKICRPTGHTTRPHPPQDTHVLLFLDRLVRRRHAGTFRHPETWTRLQRFEDARCGRSN